MCKRHRACHIFMQVPDRFQQVPTPEMWIPYKASSSFIQVPHRFQKVPTGSCKQALTRQLGLVNCWCGRWELGLGLELGCTNLLMKSKASVCTFSQCRPYAAHWPGTMQIMMKFMPHRNRILGGTRLWDPLISGSHNPCSSRKL